MSGGASLFIDAAAGRDSGGKLYLEGDEVAPFSSGFYGRAWVYFVGATPDTHSDLVFAGSDSWWRYGVEAHVWAGNWWGPGGEGAFPSDRFFTDRDAVPIDRWFCMEWHFDRVRNDMQLWVDGVAREELRRSVSAPGDDWPLPEFHTIEVGLQIFGEQQAAKVGFDDIVLDDERIGCE